MLSLHQLRASDDAGPGDGPGPAVSGSIGAGLRLGLAAGVGLLMCILSGCSSDLPPVGGIGAPAAEYVGGAECASCHASETRSWSGSHHDLAMQEVSSATVLGDFDDASFNHAGGSTVFSRRGDDFVIYTEGPDGIPAEYEVAYVFGIAPLQQYLIELDRGRIQAFDVAWDSRPASEGGQRWFHLNPEETIEPGDRLHWTAPVMNWNAMCAECHSTNLTKNFDLASMEYATTWSDIDVSCESCHGPASLHVDLARGWGENGPEDRSSEGLGLSGAMADPGGGWIVDPGETIARRTAPLPDNRQIETCAHCHARRSTISAGMPPGSPLHDSDIVSRLEEGLYHPDGQILDEVYVYGSFVQSKMYAAGVTCSDCHDPHSLELRAPGKALCAGCHLPSAYDTPEHHNHLEGSTGASCVECHMPATSYMVVDPRRDHSMLIPRPHLTARIGGPNACNGCHEDESTLWAANAVAEWYGAADTDTHYGDVIAAGRDGLPGAVVGLRALASALDQPGIVRATALAMTGAEPSAATLRAIEQGVEDSDPIVRLAAIHALEAFPSEARLRGAFRLLRDPVRAVRIEAARVLVPLTNADLSDTQRTLLLDVLEEYVGAQMTNADHPSAHTNVGNVRLQQGNLGVAELAYRDALRIDSTFVPAHLNLADLYRALGSEGEARRTLEVGLDIAPNDADLNHSLGLTLVRLGETEASLERLTFAAESAPERPRFAYVLGVALNSSGRSGEAIGVLAAALQVHPFDVDLLRLMALIHRDMGRFVEAVQYAERLVEVAPDDQGAISLLAELRRGGR